MYRLNLSGLLNEEIGRWLVSFFNFFFQVQWHPEILDNGFSKSLIDKEVERWLVSFPLKPSHNLRKPSKTR